MNDLNTAKTAADKIVNIVVDVRDEVDKVKKALGDYLVPANISLRAEEIAAMNNNFQNITEDSNKINKSFNDFDGDKQVKSSIEETIKKNK